uniref:MHC class II beta chain n=1 Tax=Serinus canaria TaxID=9135 RepID=A0A8C9N1P1_SERCA
MRARGAAEPAPLRTGAPSAARLLRGCGPCPALAMGRGAAAAAGLVALVVLGAPPAAGTELSGVFQWIAKAECYFINGTERVKYVERHSYNREQLLHFHSDVGHFVGVTPLWGEGDNSQSISRPFYSIPSPSRPFQLSPLSPNSPQLIPVCPRSLPVPPTVSISLVPSSSQPSPGCLLCSVMDFYSAHIQLRWFQGQQELPVVATDVVPNGDWTYQLLVLLETAPSVGSPTPVVGVLTPAHPPEMPLDAARSKMLTEIGGSVLDFVFLALGLAWSWAGGRSVLFQDRNPKRVSPGSSQLLTPCVLRGISSGQTKCQYYILNTHWSDHTIPKKLISSQTTTHGHGCVMVTVMVISWSCVAMGNKDTQASLLAPKTVYCNQPSLFIPET